MPESMDHVQQGGVNSDCGSTITTHCCILSIYKYAILNTYKIILGMYTTIKHYAQY